MMDASDKRAPDPYVMYLVVKTSLKMNIGKTAAQCGHAVQMFMLALSVLREIEEGRDPCFEGLTAQEAIFYDYAQHWLVDDFPSYAKIVLGASDDEFEAVRETHKEDDQTRLFSRLFVVTDRGFTSVAAGTETVLGLWPCKKSLAPESVKCLKLLR